VKILYADASFGLPNLPSNFWVAFPGNGTTTDWKPIGNAQTITSISPTRPAILEWDWVPPATAVQHSCLLIVADCAFDPIPAANKVFDIGQLVTIEKRVGLKNLHLINAVAAPIWVHLRIPISINPRDLIRLSAPPPGWSIGLLAPNSAYATLKTKGFNRAELHKQQLVALQRDLQVGYKLYSPARFQTVAAEGAELTGFSRAKISGDLLLLFTPQERKTRGSVTIVAESPTGRVIGGNTFVLTS
jgi:hypothetical protein